jgi:hypothetical protein
MKKDLSDIIEEIVQDMDNTITGVWNSVELRTDVCKTKWIRKGKKVFDSVGNEYTITDFEVDSWIKYEPAPPDVLPLEGTIYLEEPYFMTGTKMSANMEWTKEGNDLTQKTPIVWYLDFIRFREFGRDSAIDFESDVRIFFLDETNVRQFYTKDHRQEVVRPMTELLEEFISTVRKNRNFKRIDDFEILTFTRFGTEREQGYFENILDANLSGVELRVTLVKYKENCTC